MTLEQLRVFVEVAERLHVTQAAEALNVTQSAASAAIHALETGLGTPLFHRIGRRLELTEAGRVFLPEAKIVLAKVWGAEQVLAELDGLLRGRLRLLASLATDEVSACRAGRGSSARGRFLRPRASERWVASGSLQRFRKDLTIPYPSRFERWRR
jgi:DNA-binding transcriptional LysR family regulator